jgi:hypothetical protein
MMVETVFRVASFQTATKDGLKLGQILLTDRGSWVVEVYFLSVENLFT